MSLGAYDTYEQGQKSVDRCRGVGSRCPPALHPRCAPNSRGWSRGR